MHSPRRIPPSTRTHRRHRQVLSIYDLSTCDALLERNHRGHVMQTKLSSPAECDQPKRHYSAWIPHRHHADTKTIPVLRIAETFRRTCQANTALMAYCRKRNRKHGKQTAANSLRQRLSKAAIAAKVVA